ncbi:MAG: 3-hydroxyacyl-CoA dehydrogenase NAD-binding domain-containing protein [Pseudomonadota bacterium]
MVVTVRPGPVPVIVIDNPPVNALSQAVRQGLADALDAVEADADAIGAVVTGSAAFFSAGADIKEFGAPLQPPMLPDVVMRLATFPKPIVAAISGKALGGGLEVALGAHARLAAPNAGLGLPETNIGLIPGAGGTQLLPRAVGVAAALDLIVDGKPIAAAAAKSAGLVLEIVEGDVVAAAQALVDRMAGAPAPNRAAPATADDEAIAAARARAQKRYRREPARARAVDSVENATRMALPDGMAAERALFMPLQTSTESKALRHAFFAEREAAKPPANAAAAEARPVDAVAVVGAGTMGRGIAMACAAAGIDALVLDRDAAALDAARAAVDAEIDKAVEKGRKTAPAAAAEKARLRFDTDYAASAGRDLYIEAVFEDMDVKKSVFAALSDVAPADAILATNTSYLDVDAIAQAATNPGRVLGLHFFSPAHIMKLLEIVEGAGTRPDVLATGFALGKRLRKTAVRSGVCHGFIGNRMLQGYAREAGLLLLEGATPAAVDAAMRDFGMPMGPFEVGDLAGLDIGYAMRRALPEDAYDARAFAVHDALVEDGRKGRKTGGGFYDHGDTPDADAFVAARADEARARFGVAARTPDAREIVERCVYALVNEGFAILDDGIATRESDLDVVYLAGYGFPRARGGPMFYARTVGLPTVLERIEAFAETTTAGPRWWTPSEGLKNAAADSRITG